MESPVGENRPLAAVSKEELDIPTPQSALIHQFLMTHPVGRAIAAHARYGPGHPVHDMHAALQGSGPTPGLQAMSPTLTRTPSGPINPLLMRQLMAAHQGGPGGPPLPLPSGPAPTGPVNAPPPQPVAAR